MPDYCITISTKNETAERLVRAKNEARAVAHIVKDTVKVERSQVDDVVRLTKAGVELEVAE
jgi:hypothetical protein